VDTHPNEQLCPPVGKIARYHVLEWLSFAASDFHQSFKPFFAYKNAEAELTEQFLNILKKKLNYLEKCLVGREYFGAEHFTIVDPYIFVCLRWLGFAKLNLADWPNLSAYSERIIKRPSVIQAMEEEGLKVG
jgi:glutathione S-transferase